MSLSLDPALIRPHDGVLNVLKLGDRQQAGAEAVLETAKNNEPDAEFRDLDGGATGVYVDGRLVAFADPKNGESRSFARLDVLAPADGLGDRVIQGARELLARDQFIPRDATNQTLLDPLVLHGSSGSRRRASEAAPYLATARIRRDVNGVPVIGAGSQAAVTVSGDGVEAITHNWRPAEVVDEIPGGRVDAREVGDRIEKALARVTRDRDIRIESVDLVYYDNDVDVIQPVYRYHASWAGDDGITGRLLGYVPVFREFGVLPVAIERPTRRPRAPKATRPVSVRNTRPTIGRYVVRNDNAGWVASANSFLSGLKAAGVFSGIAPIDKQYYWAEPRLFTDENRQFVDSVQVALTEVHGNWNLFSTLRNNADFVRLTDIPNDGYGGASGIGSLAYWILHSCEVIPTSADSTTSYDAWWNVFNGMRAALGYRTEMWINDQISQKFGLYAGLGAPMISNWLSTIITDDSYQSGDTYLDGNVNMTEPMGRPSAINVLGHADDTIFQTSPLPKPSVLQQWWYDN